MVLPVFSLNHWGMGRLVFALAANTRLILKVLCAAWQDKDERK